MKWNKIGAEGTKAIVKSLKKNTTLIHLSLWAMLKYLFKNIQRKFSYTRQRYWK